MECHRTTFVNRIGNSDNIAHKKKWMQWLVIGNQSDKNLIYIKPQIYLIFEYLLTIFGICVAVAHLRIFVHYWALLIGTKCVNDTVWIVNKWIMIYKKKFSETTMWLTFSLSLLGDVDTVEKLIRNGHPVDDEGIERWTPLFFAVAAGIVIKLIFENHTHSKPIDILNKLKYIHCLPCRSLTCCALTLRVWCQSQCWRHFKMDSSSPCGKKWLIFLVKYQSK